MPEYIEDNGDDDELVNIDVNRPRSGTDNDLYSLHKQSISDEIEE